MRIQFSLIQGQYMHYEDASTAEPMVTEEPCSVEHARLSASTYEQYFLRFYTLEINDIQQYQLRIFCIKILQVHFFFNHPKMTTDRFEPTANTERQHIAKVHSTHSSPAIYV